MSPTYPEKSNIVLIGMPGSGKSTIGIILAKLTAKNFIDTDVLIQLEENRTLQDIVDTDGHMELRKIEERVLLGVNHRDHIIATGGSAAYSDKAMRHLQKNGLIIFLNADLTCLRSRIRNYDTRGLAKRPDQSFQDLFDERFELYNRYSDISVDCSKRTQEEVCEEIVRTISTLTSSDLPG
ncbi:shikimate kinase [Desulfosediminicola flagellatus]|uniref:shikimate kinase n=1 Tax=Desulfosediminicola flagellatus TaxID=2569541 RepID=UPI0010ACCB50|nr:shikimate kinase [Desulfosediminicola flagellatus]